MTLREAMFAAADHIETHPKEFDFNAIGVPDGCGTPGCALGWIAHFMGYPPSTLGFGFVGDQMDLPSEPLIAGFEIGDENHYTCRTFAFYNRMDRVADETPSYQWAFEAGACARTLRRYADRWHPAEVRAA
jgi:hypothetical protein